MTETAASHPSLPLLPRAGSAARRVPPREAPRRARLPLPAWLPRRILQRGGIGKQVLAECERIARDEWGLPVMRMTVIDVRAELIAFYQRRGYRRTGVFKPFPYGDTRFGLPKRQDLRFEVLEKPLRAEALA